MNYALLIFIPFTVSSGAYLTRATRSLGAWLAIGSVVVELMLTATLSTSGQLIGIDVNTHPATRPLLIAVLVLTGAIFLYAWQTAQGSILFAAGLSTLGSLTAAILLLKEPLAATTFLALAVLFATFGILSGATTSTHILASTRFVSSVIVAVASLSTAFIIAGEYSVTRELSLINVAAATLILGMALVMGAFPFHLWLADLLTLAPPAATALLLGPVAVASAGLLLVALDSFPWLFMDERTQLVAMMLGTLSAIGGAMLAFAQRSMPRLIAYSVASSSGLTIVGFASASELGITGAVFSVLSNAWSAVLVLLCLGLAAAHKEPRSRAHGMSAPGRHPVILIGLVAGSLSLVGVPPLSGFLGRWMIFQAAGARAPYLTLLMVIASAILLLAHARALQHAMSKGTVVHAPSREDWPALGIITALAAFTIAIGLYPAPVLQILSGFLGEMVLLQGL